MSLIIHKHLRIFILLLILLIVAVDNWATRMRVTDWSHTLRVVIYPINGDGSEIVEQYIKALEQADFDAIESFFTEELLSYNISLEEPINIALSKPVEEHPPELPVKRNWLDIVFWSLKLRYWAFQRDEYQGPKPEIQLFALYFDPRITSRVNHSTGLEKGQIAVINLYADKKHRGTNQFVITHELLHTLGATDKYDLSSNNPAFPHGYAEPELQPLYPQEFAEVMGGRIPQTPDTSKTPSSLDEVILGTQTAREIRLID